ncbi:MAG TPA: hypothetical protein PLV50_03955 [Smithella sp.]|nr:hypothetical protein [Smithella sp.]HNY49854.1 hypothetical protein [Smithella sp.]HOG89666.1 hypothetical protein [Smithella sp.]
MFVKARDVSIASRLWLVAHEMCPPFANQVILEGRGRLNVEEWIRAVKLASDANPGSRLVLRGHLGMSRWVDSGQTPPLRMIDAGDWDGCSSEGAPFLEKSFFPRRGPMAEVVLIQGDPLRVAFRSHHAVMDGRGTVFWAEEIFRVLRGESPLGSDTAITENALLNISKQKLGTPIQHNYIAPTGRAIGNEPGVIWKRTRISGRYPRLLIQIILLTAREAWKHGSGPVRLGIPVDLRARRKGLRSTGNLTNALFLEITPDTTLESLDAELAFRLREQRDGQLTWEDKIISHLPLSVLDMLLSKETRRSHRSGNYRFSGFVSNMGRFSMEGFSGGGFHADMYWAVPVCMESVPFSLVLTGAGDFVDMILAMPRALANQQVLDETLGRIGSGLVTETR